MAAGKDFFSGGDQSNREWKTKSRAGWPGLTFVPFITERLRLSSEERPIPCLNFVYCFNFRGPI
jgi:hypothetical protein